MDESYSDIGGGFCVLCWLMRKALVLKFQTDEIKFYENKAMPEIYLAVR